MLRSIQNLVEFCPLILKILSGNEILILIKGCNSLANLHIMMHNNPNLDLVNIDVHTKFGHILSIGFQDNERNRNITE